jgi:hypothetical protein
MEPMVGETFVGGGATLPETFDECPYCGRQVVATLRGLEGHMAPGLDALTCRGTGNLGVRRRQELNQRAVEYTRRSSHVGRR